MIDLLNSIPLREEFKAENVLKDLEVGKDHYMAQWGPELYQVRYQQMADWVDFKKDWLHITGEEYCSPDILSLLKRNPDFDFIFPLNKIWNTETKNLITRKFGKEKFISLVKAAQIYVTKQIQTTGKELVIVEKKGKCQNAAYLKEALVIIAEMLVRAEKQS